MNLKNMSLDEIIKFFKEKKVTVSDFVDSGLCPTCFDKEHNNILYGDKKDIMLYEDNLFECFLVTRPKAIGHTIINTKKHFKDMMEIDDDTCEKIFVLAKKLMIILKDVYKAESVYLCTMCDGPMNHFHLQLIPRYSYEKRGSNNFVKPRMEYVDDMMKINDIRKRMKVN